MALAVVVFFTGFIYAWSLRLSSTANTAVALSRNTSSSTIVANASVIPSIGPWPQAFILGGQKCASTSLWSVLIKHVELCKATPNPVLGDSAFADKEVHFFDNAENYAKSSAWYLRHFGHDPKCNGGKYMDATPNYIHIPEAASRLFYSLNPTLRPVVRFVVILREPISRDLSWFNHMAQSGDWYEAEEFSSYESYANNSLAFYRPLTETALSWGIYHTLLDTWLQLFARKQLYIVSFHVMIKNQERTIVQIASFFGVNPNPLRGKTLPHKNEKAYSKKVEMESVACATRAKLSAFFHPHNELLYRMLADSVLDGTAPPEEPHFERFPSVTC